MASVPPSVPPNVTKTDSGEPVTFTITETGKLPITNYVYNSDSFYYIYRSSLPLSETIMNEYLTKNAYNEIIVKRTDRKYEDGVNEQKKITNEIPIILCHYMTLDFENMKIKRNRNANFVMDKNDSKYTKEWYNSYFKDDVMDTRMYKYIDKIKYILNNV